MALTQTQQILEAIKRSTRPLICVAAGAGVDGYASALGLVRVLKKLEKSADVVAADGPAPKVLTFLPGHEAVTKNLEHMRRFVIELDASKTEVGELEYEIKNGKLLIHLSPKSGFWEASDVKTSTTGYRYDLVFVIGAPDLESCGHVFATHPDFFYRTPIVNIDHTAHNEQFGHMNVVDLTATSCGEVCHDLVDAMDPGLMDEEIATAFLTGMIAKTKSFKHARVTPKTLETAGKLMGKGANRDQIIQHLYRTRSVSTLRLWGRALARLKVSEKDHLVWTLLTRQDFVNAGTTEEHLEGIVDEVLASTPHARIVAILYEGADQEIHALIRAERPYDALALTRAFASTGNREETRATFSKNDIVAVERELITGIREQLKKTV